ncbi:MAG: peptidoglycan DD-metalloendopeptidase family protein [Patescibacteria group bacterium]|nr:peptidoglycan DD-metalloendopeptidase family protein [Patescibacteria group bacterium]
MRKIIFFFSIIIALAAGLLFKPDFAFASEVGGSKEEIDELNQQINQRKDKIKQLEETIGKYQKNIDEKRLEAVSLKNQMSILDNRTAQVEADIELTKEKINEARLEIEALELTIKEKETAIARQKRIIIKIMQNVNAQDQKSYLEILLTNKSFSDFYNQVQYLENIYTDLGSSIKLLRLMKEDLEAKKKQIEDKKTLYEQLKKDLEEKKNNLKEQTNIKQNLLAQTHSSELKYRTLLSSLKQQYQAVENEVRNYEEQVRKKLAEEEKFKQLQEAGSVILSWPVLGRYITSIFHDPDYPYRNVFEHSGIDIRSPQGSPVKAAAAGYVARAKRCSNSSCYSYVLIVHTGDISTLYGHLSTVLVEADQFVNRGDIIGYSGGTPGTVGAGPFVTGPHLHFETRLNGIPVDPRRYLAD